MVVHKVIGGFVGLYKIVPLDEAHVRTMLGKKNLFSNREYKGEVNKSDYWVVPFVTKIVKLPLTNIRIDVPDVKLNDKDMAKFVCDIVCFVNIVDPFLTAERTGITVESRRFEDDQNGINVLSKDFAAIMESIGRTVATKQTILEIYKDRSKLDEAVTEEVEKVFPRWGLQLVDLEIKDIKDAQGSTIIQDIERKQASQISADARVKIAEENKRAEIVEAETKKESELIKAKTQEEYRKRQIETERTIAISQQQKNMQESEMKKLANEKEVEAKRSLDLGNAEYMKEVVKTNAEAKKLEIETIAQADSKKIELLGNAEATIIKSKKIADAEGTEKLAVAQQKFTNSAQAIELIKAHVTIQSKYADAQAEAYKNAKINIVAGSTHEVLSGGILGNIKLGGKEGVAVEQFLQSNPALLDLAKQYVGKQK